MSRLTTGILGAIALSLTFGAAQFALGRGLPEATAVRVENSSAQALAASVTAINRAAKADRAASVAGSPARTRTIALRLDGFSDTSFLLRVPVSDGAGSSPTVPSITRSQNRKLTVACEPVVSVLTEVARLLQPGRCVT
jgi:hypothetical protein